MAKALASSLGPKNLIVCVGLIWLVAFVCTSCVDGLVFPHSKVGNIFMSSIGGPLGITLSIDIMAF